VEKLIYLKNGDGKTEKLNNKIRRGGGITKICLKINV